VLTSTQNPGEKQALERLGVAAFFTKPSDYEHFMALGLKVKALIEGRAAGQA
jgi:hypothetical protein